MGDSGRAATLVQLFEKAQAAADRAGEEAPAGGGAEEEEKAAELLSCLKDFPVTTALLLETQLGKRVRKLTKHPRAGVKAAASELLEAWKRAVTAESTHQKAANGGAPNGAARAAGGDGAAAAHPKLQKSLSCEAGLSSPGPQRAAGAAVKVEPDRKPEPLALPIVDGALSIGDGKQAGAKKMGGIPKTGDTLRDKMRELLCTAMGAVEAEAAGREEEEMVKSSDPARAAADVESEMWQCFGAGRKGDMKDYKAKFRTISFNLKDPNNPDLRRRVLLGEVAPAVLVTMAADDMASDARKAENVSIKRRATEEAVRGQAAAASTDQFKCGKCGHRKTTYYQLQTRSADEPMTTYVTCVNCNNRWKFC